MPTSSNRPNRSTESALSMPSAGRALLLAARALRLRCPHCGQGRVLKGFNEVQDHCAACGFRFTRSDDNYFSGAMFFGMLIGETLAVVIIGAGIWISYPDVPWGWLQYGIPVLLLAVMIALFPLSRVVWLAIDVMMRPVQPSELVAT